MVRHIVKMIFAFAIGLLVSSVANAALLDGKKIGFEYLFPTITSPNPYLFGAGIYEVGAGVESHALMGESSTDFSDTNITIDFNIKSKFASASFHGVHYYDVLGDIDDFTSVSLNGITNLAGLSQANITFDANNIWINWPNLAFDVNTVVSIDLRGSPAHVSESSPLFLLMIGLLMFVARRRV